MISAKDIVRAHKILESVVVYTPLDYDTYLSEKYKAKIYLKKENEQRVRSFKLRGAYYAISQLSQEEKERGVVCASAGNHAQGVAYTCREMKIHATIFMPIPTPQQKVAQVKFFGGSYVDIRLIGDTFDESAKASHEFTKKENRTFIAPFDDANVQAGQGTVAYEILEEAKREGIVFDQFLVPVGGGGLIAGMATFVKDTAKEIVMTGVEAQGARSMAAAFEAGHPVRLDKIDKFADGIAVQQVGDLTYQVAKEKVDQLVAVPEGLISETVIDLYSKQGIVAEPAGAASVAALEVIKEQIVGKTICCVVSGGNNDIHRMPEMEERTLIYQGLKHYFVINFPQRPGALREFVTDILGPRDDITRFEYIKRVDRGKGPCLIGIALENKDDYEELIKRIEQFDPQFINLHGNETLYNMLV